jgi:hypothetical protein
MKLKCLQKPLKKGQSACQPQNAPQKKPPRKQARSPRQVQEGPGGIASTLKNWQRTSAPGRSSARFPCSFPSFFSLHSFPISLPGKTTNRRWGRGLPSWWTDDTNRVSNLLGRLGALFPISLSARLRLASLLFCTFFFVVGINLLFNRKVFSIWRNLKYVTFGLLIASVAFASCCRSLQRWI